MSTLFIRATDPVGNAELAKRCEEEGIIFIGPKVEHLIMFGDKINDSYSS